jgi:gliding motility-associated-like protein
MFKKLLLFSFLLIGNSILAQKQANFWYFGTLAGLDFTSGSPVPINNSPINTAEGVSSISDSLGNLLFYTDGIQVWDNTNTQMTNGFGLKGDISTTQVLITPNPGNNDLFYIFTIDDEGGPDGLNYSVVDMTLNGGKGDVSVKNTFLRSGMTEKLAAVYHCNNHDIWLMAHGYGNNTFYAYLITDTGIDPPVISNVGPIHGDVHGQMKFNNLGTRIACSRDTVLNPFPAFLGNGFADLLDFDKSTGFVSNPQTLSLNYQKTYGIEFSPDNTKLYVSAYDVTGAGNIGISQFDLSSANIQASEFNVGNSFDPQILRSLQLGPDNKIYVAKSNGPFICVINNPNVSGAGCTYVDNAINIDPLGNGNTVLLGLPGFVSSFFNPSFPSVPCIAPLNVVFSSTDTTICQGQCIDFNDLSSASASSWQWTFQGASSPSSSAQNPMNVCYPAAGTYPVKLVASDGSTTDSSSYNIIVVAPPVVNAGPGGTIQTGSSFQLNASSNGSGFSWSPSAGLTSATILNPVASPSSTTTYVLTATGLNGCSSIDSTTITVETPCGKLFVPTAFSPNADGHNDVECVLGDCISILHFAIYDRWGEKVFETNNTGECWDGSYKGKIMNTATFVYYLKATLQSGEEISQKGNINLIR